MDRGRGGSWIGLGEAGVCHHQSVLLVQRELL